MPGARICPPYPASTIYTVIVDTLLGGPILGSFWVSPGGSFWGSFWVPLGAHFGSPWELIWGPIVGPHGDRIGADLGGRFTRLGSGFEVGFSCV